MALTGKQRDLIQKLEGTKLLAGRYGDLTCVNRSDTKEIGVLSLVFKATDTKTGSLVAVKFFDPERLSDLYRLAAFRREPEILNGIIGQKRCLQIVEELQQFNWEIETPSGPMTFPIEYFVTEWIESGVGNYLSDQKNLQTLVKLSFFRDLILAVEAIQRKELVHRDLKPDNIRSKVVSDESVVALIDFGTSARYDSAHLKDPSSYNIPVGARVISAPEAFAGFASDRKLGHLADHFALGTLIFDLFNETAFRHAQSQDTQYKDVLDQMVLRQCNSPERTDRLGTWSSNFQNFRNILTNPKIDGEGNSIPTSIQENVIDIYQRLIHFNFLERESNLVLVRRKVDIAIKILNNTRKARRVAQRKHELRQARKVKAEAKEVRLNEYLASKGTRLCS